MILLAMLVISLGCTETKTDTSTDQTGGAVVSSQDTAQIDQTIDDLSTDIDDMDALINDSVIDIEDVVIDESLI